MELLSLILVNICALIIIYFIFSIRFSRALRESREVHIIRELKENIESTIEFINTSLDLMDQKLASFYQLLRKAEEIKNLNNSAVEKKEIPSPESKKGSDFDIKSLNKSMQHLLEKMEDDKLEISSLPDESIKTIYSAGELSKEYSPEANDNHLSTVNLVSPFKRIKKLINVFKLRANKKANAVVEKYHGSGVLNEETNKQLSVAQDILEKQEEAVSLESFLEMKGFHKIPESGTERMDLIRLLLKQAFLPKEIVNKTGVSMAEVELIASLPENMKYGRKRRRKKSGK